jgi:hypothetical protein
MRGSGVACTSSALFGFEQTVGVDLSLERRPKGEPCRLGSLARVVGRVESVCTDPSTKSPTGPFCLVHLLLPVASGGSRRVLSPTASSWRPCPAGSAERSLHRRAVIRPRSACCLAAPGAEFRRRSENQLTLRPHQLGRKGLCTISCGCLTVRVIASISCTKCLARQAEPE